MIRKTLAKAQFWETLGICTCPLCTCSGRGKRIGYECERTFDSWVCAGPAFTTCTEANAPMGIRAGSSYTSAHRVTSLAHLPASRKRRVTHELEHGTQMVIQITAYRDDCTCFQRITFWSAKLGLKVGCDSVSFPSLACFTHASSPPTPLTKSACLDVGYLTMYFSLVAVQVS